MVKPAHCSSEFDCRDEWRYLKYAFRSRDAEPNIVEEIRERRGIGWAVLYVLANTFPGLTNLIEVMHCVFLCQFLHLD